MSQVEIILGPTNTGKTFYAFEQMFSYQSGVFGFPLRLLARENYDKACKLYPINQIALITGEEKIIPTDAKYFFCTVESMPEGYFEFVAGTKTRQFYLSRRCLKAAGDLLFESIAINSNGEAAF